MWNVIELSKIQNWENKSLEEMIDYCLDNNINTIINDYGFGLEYDLADLLIIWEHLKRFKNAILEDNLFNK